MVFLAFINNDPAGDQATPNSPRGGSDSAQEETQSELERKGFHYMNDVQVSIKFWSYLTC